MKLREKVFLIELLIFIFLGAGIAGNGDLDIDTPIRIWIEFVISGILTFSQMKYCERQDKNDKELDKIF